MYKADKRAIQREKRRKHKVHSRGLRDTQRIILQKSKEAKGML